MSLNFATQLAAMCKRRDAAVEQLSACEAACAASVRGVDVLKRRVAVEAAAAAGMAEQLVRAAKRPRAAAAAATGGEGGREADPRVESAALIVRSVMEARAGRASECVGRDGVLALARALVSRGGEEAMPTRATWGAAPNSLHGARVPDVFSSAHVEPCDLRASPLLQFRAFRVHPAFALTGVSRGSASVTNALDPAVPLCRFEVRGVCNDPACPFQHARQFLLGEREARDELHAYAPAHHAPSGAAYGAPSDPGAASGAPADPAPSLDAIAEDVWRHMVAQGVGMSDAAEARARSRRAGAAGGGAAQVAGSAAAAAAAWAPRWVAGVYDRARAAPERESTSVGMEWIDAVPARLTPGGAAPGRTALRGAEALLDETVLARLGLRPSLVCSAGAGVVRAATDATVALRSSVITFRRPPAGALADGALSTGGQPSAEGDAGVLAEFVPLLEENVSDGLGGGDCGNVSADDDEDAGARYFRGPVGSRAADAPACDAPSTTCGEEALHARTETVAARDQHDAVAICVGSAGAWLIPVLRELLGDCEVNLALSTLLPSMRTLSSSQARRAAGALRRVSVALEAPETHCSGAGWAVLLRLLDVVTVDGGERLRVALYAAQCAPASCAVWAAAAVAVGASDSGTHRFVSLLDEAVASVLSLGARPVTPAASWFLVACAVRRFSALWVAGHGGFALLGLEELLRPFVCSNACTAVHSRFEERSYDAAAGGSRVLAGVDPRAGCFMWQFYVFVVCVGALPSEDALADAAFALRFAPSSSAAYRLTAHWPAPGSVRGFSSSAADCAVSAWWRWSRSVAADHPAADTMFATLGCSVVDIELARMRGQPLPDVWPRAVCSPFLDASREAGSFSTHACRHVLMAALDGITSEFPRAAAERIVEEVLTLADDDASRDVIRFSAACALVVSGATERAVDFMASCPVGTTASSPDGDVEVVAVRIVCRTLTDWLTGPRTGSVALGRSLGSLMSSAAAACWPLWLCDRVWRLRAAVHAAFDASRVQDGRTKSAASGARSASFAKRAVHDMVSRMLRERAAVSASFQSLQRLAPEECVEEYLLELSQLSFGPPTLSLLLRSLVDMVRSRALCTSLRRCDVIAGCVLACPQNRSADFAPQLLSALELLHCSAACDLAGDGSLAVPAPMFRIAACVWAAATSALNREEVSSEDAMQVALLGALRARHDEGAWVSVLEAWLTHSDVAAAAVVSEAARRVLPHSATLWRMVRAAVLAGVGFGVAHECLPYTGGEYARASVRTAARIPALRRRRAQPWSSDVVEVRFHIIY